MSVNHAELALIELEYSAADRFDCQSATSDASKPSEITLRLPNILIFVAAIRFALDAMQVAFDRKGLRGAQANYVCRGLSRSC
jgi:hypothetical protein